ncbi:hypothetical protein Pla123a_14360 [Posidoniimonas polymericola]|uniref:PEP-CTERM protein-sorting domain-containing protein n=1 Tax=Posidoniimonas polymericola TaxID=2528002 RepID=A0A5C5YSB3_9BACT|nr:hypothetical protein [Posidoniimonas polymericola]TWT77640.1 hypothetical protein Pla123a_14360 [Posidoniimonas polymericola]
MRFPFLAAAIAVAALFGLTGSAAAQVAPIAVTGWTEDFVINDPAPYNLSVTGTVDGGIGNPEGYTWVEEGTYTNPNGDPEFYFGLTAGVQTSLTGNGTFEFQDFSANNVVALDGGASGTLTLDTPAAYEAIALYGAVGGGGKTADVLLTFDDASTATFMVSEGTGIGTDWFNNNADKALAVLGRASNKSEEGYTRLFRQQNDAISINESLFVLDPADQLKLLTSVTITNTSGSNGMTVFALSGGTAPVPEPAAAALLCLSTAGVVAGRRDR